MTTHTLCARTRITKQPLIHYALYGEYFIHGQENHIKSFSTILGNQLKIFKISKNKLEINLCS